MLNHQATSLKDFIQLQSNPQDKGTQIAMNLTLMVSEIAQIYENKN